MALSGLAIAGIIIIVIGIIMAIIGIILLIVEDAGTISWYVWLLVIGGILMAIIGGVILAVALSEESTYSPCAPPKPKCPLPVPLTVCNMGHHHHGEHHHITNIPQQTCPLMNPVHSVVPVTSTVVPVTSTVIPVTSTVTPTVIPVTTNISTMPKQNIPIPVYRQKVVQLGNETFDPDPETTVVVTPGQSIRRAVTGPYGNGGTETQVTGVHTIPEQNTYITKNIPKHDVISDHSDF